MGWPKSSPGRFTPVKDPVPIVVEAGLVPEPVWTGIEKRKSLASYRGSMLGPFSARTESLGISQPMGRDSNFGRLAVVCVSRKSD